MIKRPVIPPPSLSGVGRIILSGRRSSPYPIPHTCAPFVLQTFSEFDDPSQRALSLMRFEMCDLDHTGDVTYPIIVIAVLGRHDAALGPFSLD